MDKDAAGNVTRGEGEIILEATRNSFAYSEQPCVALLGVENVVVVAAMEDAVLVASKEHAEQVKGIVEQLKGNGRAHALQHNRVYRPWGWYQTLNRGDRYQVKCIMVKPGGKLSLQSHHHRSEHWVVVKGTLEVTKGEDTELLSENQSTYIPIGKQHRLANPARSRPSSSRSSPVPISTRTTSCASRTSTAAARTNSPQMRLPFGQSGARQSLKLPAGRSASALVPVFVASALGIASIVALVAARFGVFSGYAVLGVTALLLLALYLAPFQPRRIHHAAVPAVLSVRSAARHKPTIQVRSCAAGPGDRVATRCLK